jgi:hypothetical protein
MSVCRQEASGLFWEGSRFPGSGGLGLLRCQLGYNLRPEGIKGDFVLNRKSSAGAPKSMHGQ